MAISRENELMLLIERQQDALMAQMDGSLKEVFKSLTEQVLAITDDLSLDPKDRAKNLREMLRMKKQITDTIINNKAYQNEVANLIDGFDSLADLSDSYIGLILDQPYKRKALYNAILQTNIEVTKDALLGAGINNNFSNAIQEVLKTNIAGTTKRSELRQILTKFIQGSDEEKAYLERYIKQTTNDSIMVFNREYIQAISDDLNFGFYRYKGTVIEDTRPFCQTRSGKVYTKEEVKKWADLGGWQGMMAGTTQSTIFSYCGGYNCRHTLYPISEARYRKEKGLPPK